MPFNPTTNVQFQQGLAMIAGGDQNRAMRGAMIAQENESRNRDRQRQDQARESFGQAIAGGIENIDAETLAAIAKVDTNMAMKIIQMKQDASNVQLQHKFNPVTGEAVYIDKRTGIPINGMGGDMGGGGENPKAQQKRIEAQIAEDMKPPTAAQADASAFYNRMTKAEELLTPLEGQGVSTADITNAAKEDALFGLGNYLTSEPYKMYKQAAEDWVRAKLRKESGAVISPKEMRDEIKTYFPQPGDTPNVIKQKRTARSTALQGMEGMMKPGSIKPTEGVNANDLKSLSTEELQRMLEE